MTAGALSIYPAVQINLAASDEKGLGRRAKGPFPLGAGARARALVGAGAGALIGARAGAMRGAITGAQSGAMSPDRPLAARDTAPFPPLVMSMGCWDACTRLHAAVRQVLGAPWCIHPKDQLRGLELRFAIFWPTAPVVEELSHTAYCKHLLVEAVDSMLKPDVIC